MKSLSFLFFYLMLITGSLTANGQANKPNGGAIQPVSAPERHRNPDFQEPAYQSLPAPGGRNRLFRSKPAQKVEEYAVSIKSYEAETLTQLPPDNVQFGYSPNGQWLIVRPNYSGSNKDAPFIWKGQEAVQHYRNFPIFRP